MVSIAAFSFKAITINVVSIETLLKHEAGVWPSLRLWSLFSTNSDTRKHQGPRTSSPAPVTQGELGLQSRMLERKSQHRSPSRLLSHGAVGVCPLAGGALAVGAGGGVVEGKAGAWGRHQTRTLHVCKAASADAFIRGLC